MATADYWVRHVREAVRFADGVATLFDQGATVFLEIGPKPTLIGMVEQVADALVVPPSRSMVVLDSLREHQPDWQSMLMSLGELYVHGVRIDWAAVECAGQHQKVLLPTYPFQRQRYWPETADLQRNGPDNHDFAGWLAGNSVAELTDRIAERMAGGQPPAEEARTTVAKVLDALDADRRDRQSTAQIESMLYEVVWEQQRRLPPPTTLSVSSRWILLAGVGGPSGALGQALADHLVRLGEHVDFVRTAGELAALTDFLAGQPDGACPLRGLLHLWALDDDRQALTDGAVAVTAAELMRRQERNLGSVVHVVQSMAGTGLGRRGSGTSPRLWVVTQGAQQLAASEPVAIAQTALWGLGRVVALEHGELWGGLIDLDAVGDPAQQAHLLLAELLSAGADGEEQVAYRRSERHVARLVPARPVEHAGSPAISGEGTYLVTGGLGSLGLETARWLVQSGARHLVLTGRRGVQSKKQQAILDELQNAGAMVRVATVDVTDAAGMAQLMGELASTAQPLRG